MQKPAIPMLIAAVVTIAGYAVWKSSSAPTPSAEPVVTDPVAENKADKKPKKKSTAPSAKYRAVPKPEKKLSCPECNVILISIDTLRADHLGTYGYERNTSPRLDKFAKQSLVFENAISQSSWTSPAHASMLTGLLPRDHGMLLYPAPGTLKPETPTLASRLKAAGYQTAAWHGGGYVTNGMSGGFTKWKSLGRKFKPNLDAARNWLRTNADKPFFLFVHGYDVHKPYDQYKDNTFHKPQQPYDMKTYCVGERRVRTGDELAYVIAQYDAGIVAADRVVGKFLSFLRDKRLLDNSIVIITSDHGDEFFEHGKCDHKHSVYRELTHVPLIVHLPSKLRQRIPAQVAASVSVTPTVLGLLGLDQGVDMTYDLRGVVQGTSSHPAVISETGRFHGPSLVKESGYVPKQGKLQQYTTSVTTDDRKLIYNNREGAETWELYDVAEKPAEQNDLAAKERRQVTRLRPKLFPTTGEPVLPKVPTEKMVVDKRMQESLRALGYVQ